MNLNLAQIQFPYYIVADMRAVYNNAGVWENRGGTVAVSDDYKGNYQYRLLHYAGQVMHSGKRTVTQVGIVAIPLKNPTPRAYLY